MKQVRKIGEQFRGMAVIVSKEYKGSVVRPKKILYRSGPMLLCMDGKSKRERERTLVK